MLPPRNRIFSVAIWVTFLIGLIASAPGAAAAPATQPTTRPIHVLVLTGGHGYDVKAFPKLFEGHADLAVTHYALKAHSEIFDDISNWKYDVVVFYNMTQIFPEDRRANFLKLLDRGVGVVALHHNIWAYQEWPEFARIIGGRQFSKPAEFDGKSWPQSTYKHDVDFKVRVEPVDHPVTKGMKDFTIRDESYHGLWLDPAAKVLLTTDEPTSDRPLAWAKTYRQSRTVCIQLGHGPGIFTDENYRLFVVNAIRWTASGRSEK